MAHGEITLSSEESTQLKRSEQDLFRLDDEYAGLYGPSPTDNRRLYRTIAVVEIPFLTTRPDFQEQKNRLILGGRVAHILYGVP